MPRYVNIGELADQVMDSVKTASVTKTASVASPKIKTSPAARELRKLAEDLRQMPEQDDVADEDLAALMQDDEVALLLEELQNNPELLEQLLAAQDGGDADGLPEPGMEVPPEQDPAMGIDPNDPDNDGDAAGDLDGDGDGPPENAASAEIRKVAAYLRTNEKRFKQIRMLKAANMLQAATALKHLTGGTT